MKFSDTVKFVMCCAVGFSIGYAISHARKLTKQKQEELEFIKELDRQNKELEELAKVFEKSNTQQIKLENEAKDLLAEFILLREKCKEAD